MKKVWLFLSFLSYMMIENVFAYDLALENSDGVIIYYNYSADAKELEVTNGQDKYKGAIVIPEEVTFMNRTRKVAAICSKAFYDCAELTSIHIPESVDSIGSDVFYRSTALTSIIFPSSVKKVIPGAFCLY